MSDMEDRMHTGEMYLPHDEQILARQFDCLERLYDFNQTRPHELDRRAELLHDMFAEIGHAGYIELRERGYQYNMPVRIGENCWIGAGVVVLPGVTIGDNVVVGAGSIVTRDLPSNVVAVGNPCHVLREVGERDREYYFKDRRIDWNEMRADEAAH